MRKIIVLEFMSLDGVIQAPGAPNEDNSDGFKYGGWMVPYSDEFTDKIMKEQFGHEFDLLLGRKTFDIWAAHWPQANGGDNPFNKATKYVVSKTLKFHEWEKSIFINDNIAEEIKKLKEQDRPELQVYGSADLLQTLMKHDLVDEFWLKIFPVTLGKGKRLFVDGSIPAAFTLTECKHSPKGVIFANYKRGGEVETGSFEE